MAVGLGGLDQTKSDINVTPLIDVLLVLLVLFMIITPLLTKALDSAIPKTSEQTLPPEFSEKQLVLTITQDGRFQLNREEIGLTQLGARLHGVFTQRGSGERVIFINADDEVPYGTIVQAMDICRGAGAEDVGIVTEAIEVSK
ncbi:MAG TPA: biopolymer transporter ExbD [Steroidobacteraceae bacterium]|jgi:biopolymer transport protein ExbD|nr:biopolymer transporter ExbD [Steroidobacteraceae bacterium]HXS08813.1 biopolymer transporter ExbD [Candidatus Krumholzibacteria bacterium]